MLSQFKRPRRVVITGMGCVTPIGLNRDEFWDSLIKGRSGVSKIEAFDVSQSPVQIAAQVRNFDWEAEINRKDRRHMPRAMPMVLAATREAINDAGVNVETLSLSERQHAGVVLGTGGGGLTFAEEQYRYWYLGPHQKLSPYAIPWSTHGSLSSEVSITFKLHGISHIVSTGCTSSTDAIGYAAQQIALGRLDLAISGGVDTPIAPGMLIGYDLMTVLTRDWNDDPSRSSRPFSRDRTGMVLGEGAWIYLLEEKERAELRGAKIYAEVVGYGSTCDAFHRVRLREDGVEPARAMELAMVDAGITSDQVNYVNVHGTSTILNDRTETKALKLVFGEAAYRIPMSATKSQIGHPQGASGAAGLGATLCAMETGRIPPTINLEESDPDCDLDYVPNTSRHAEIRIALCNCIGFGSKNSALVIQRS